MLRHWELTTGAAYTQKDSARPLSLCRACLVDTMQHTPPHTQDTIQVAGTQICLDAHSHGNKSYYRGFKYCDIFADLNTGRVLSTRSSPRTEWSCATDHPFYLTPTPSGGVRGATAIDSYALTQSSHTGRPSSCNTIVSTVTGLIRLRHVTSTLT
jgi:hypothetical protein